MPCKVMHRVALLFFIIFKYISCNEIHHISERSLLFPQYTVLQFTYGVSAPVILPNKTFQLSLCVQQNYDLPFNISNLRPTIYAARGHKENNHIDDGFDLDRHTFYTYVIDFIESFGFNGEKCLLRAICEISEVPMYTENAENNLLENIVHYIFTPSTDQIGNDTNRSDFYEKIIEAENIGKHFGECDAKYRDCDLAIIDLFTSKIISIF